MAANEPAPITSPLLALNRALATGTFVQIRQMLNGMEPAEIAHLLESSPPRDRHVIWKLIEKDEESEVLSYLSEEIRAQFLSRMDTSELVSFLEELDTDDIADLLQELPENVTRQVLESMTEQNRDRVEHILSYSEDTAGGLMNTDTVSIRADITLDVVMRYLRMHEEIPEMTDKLWVVNRRNQYIGLLPLTKLLISDPNMTVREAMITDVKAISAETPAREVANLFERRDYISAPVVDKEGVLVGRITIDDVVDVIREEADHSLMSMAGLDEYEDTFAPALKTVKGRATWLGINLATCFIASSVIGLFENTISHVVALAVLMPIVASMGGVAGTQTITLMVRGLALGQIQGPNARWLLLRELSVAAMNGILWALVVGAASAWWFSDRQLGLIIGSAMIINLGVAALVGVTLPLLLKKLGIDPVLAGGVILTTFTDVVGFFSFLGLATMFYL